MNGFVKLLHILSWIVIAFIKLILVLIGFFVIPIALITRKRDGSFLLPFWMFDNDEEQCPGWWFKYVRKLQHTGNFWEDISISLKQKFPRFWWYAVRNPINNMRYIFDDSDDFEFESNVFSPEYVEPQMLVLHDLGPSAYIWRWNGIFAGYRKVWINKKDPKKYSEIWFGWKVGSRIEGMGFTTQIRINRTIGVS